MLLKPKSVKTAVSAAASDMPELTLAEINVVIGEITPFLPAGEVNEYEEPINAFGVSISVVTPWTACAITA